MFPHPPHDQPDLVDELGSPGVPCASAANVGVVDLLVGTQSWGDSAHEEILPAQSVLEFDGLPKSSGALNWWGIIGTVPEGQTLDDGVLKGHVGLHHLKPCDEILPGVSPQIAGSHIQTPKDMGGGLIGFVTPWAVVMALVFASLEVPAHTALAGTVFAQPSLLAKRFPVHGSVQGLPVNAIMKKILWNVVQFLPLLFSDGSIDLLVEGLLAYPGQFVSLEMHLHPFMRHVNIQGWWSIPDLPQASLGIVVHVDVEARPPVQKRCCP